MDSPTLTDSGYQPLVFPPQSPESVLGSPESVPQSLPESDPIEFEPQSPLSAKTEIGKGGEVYVTILSTSNAQLLIAPYESLLELTDIFSNPGRCKEYFSRSTLIILTRTYVTVDFDRLSEVCFSPLHVANFKPNKLSAVRIRLHTCRRCDCDRG